MSESCALVPKVKRREGKKIVEKESILFGDIKAAVKDYETAWDMYTYTLTDDFKSKIPEDAVYDNLGEITFPYFIKILGLDQEYNDSKGIDSIKREYGIGNKVFKSPQEAMHVANAINKKEKDFVAVLTHENDGYVIKIANRNSSAESTASKQSFNNALTVEIVNMLRSLGFDISIDENASYAGLFDPTNTTLHDGLLQIIRIAKGEVGEQALPEEFSHLIIEGLINHPLVQRLLNSINDEVIQEVLGSQYEHYSEKYNGDEERLKKEAAGKMLGEYIANKGTLYDRSKRSLLARIWRWAKNLFKRLTGNDVMYARHLAQQSIENIYSLIATDRAIPMIDKHSILNADTLYSLQEEFNTTQKILNECRTRHAFVVRGDQRLFDRKMSKEDYNLQTNLKQLEEGDDNHASGISMFMSEAVSRIDELNEAYTKRAEALEAGGLTEIEDLNEAAKIFNMASSIVSDNGYGGIIRFLTSISEHADELGISQIDAVAIANSANDCNTKLQQLQSGIASMRVNLLVNAFRTVFKQDRAIEGMNAPQAYLCLEEIVKHAFRDIGWADRWFTAMSDADDPLLVIVENLVKTQHFKRDMRMNEVFKRIALENKKLKDAGYDSSFMLELDKDGVPTLRIISPYDWTEYTKDKAALVKRLREEGKTEEEISKEIAEWESKDVGGKGPRVMSMFVNPEHEKLFKAGRISEIPVNAAIEKFPNPKVYDKKANTIESLPEAQRNYYNAMIQLKREMMSLIPHKGQMIYRAINISQGVAENLFDNNTGNPLPIIAEALKRKFIRRPDDIGFGLTDDFQAEVKKVIEKEKDPEKASAAILDLLVKNIDPDIKLFLEPKSFVNYLRKYKDDVDKAVEAVIDRIANEDFYQVDIDFGGQQMDRLPIYYSRRLKDPKTISRDFSSCMSAYAAMAINYNEMSKVVDILELLRGHLNDDAGGRTIQAADEGGKKRARFVVAGNKYIKDIVYPGSKSGIATRYDAWMDSVVYEKRKQVEEVEMFGTNWDVGKLSDTLRDYSGLLGLGLNVFSTFSNITVGKIQQWIEAFAGEWFGWESYIKAIGQYTSMIGEHLGEMNNPIKKSKLSLLIEMFDPMGEYFESLRTAHLNKSAVSRLLGNNTFGYIGMHAGEHLLHCQTMLAILNEIKLTDEKGDKISLFDALEVKEDKGIYRLELKKGLSYERNIVDTSGNKDTNKNFGKLKRDKDGKLLKEKVTLDTQDKIMEFIMKRRNVVRKVNDSLNGAFAADDKGAIHRYAIWRLVMQFRQWMPAHYERRFARGHWDQDLEQWREGYYVTVAHVLNNLARDIKKGQFDLLSDYVKGVKYTEHEIANLRRATAEVGMFVTLLITSLVGDRLKDKDSSWGEKMFIYQLHRMALEVGASVPSHMFIKNIFQLMNSPAPVVNTLERIRKFINFGDMFNEVESGRYEGWYQWQKELFIMLPYTDQIVKAVYFDDSMFTMFNEK